MFSTGTAFCALCDDGSLVSWGYLNFGGGRTNDENDSLLQFKKSFSNILSEFYIAEKIYNEDLYAELTIATDKKMFYSYRNDDFIS